MSNQLYSKAQEGPRARPRGDPDMFNHSTSVGLWTGIPSQNWQYNCYSKIMVVNFKKSLLFRVSACIIFFRNQKVTLAMPFCLFIFDQLIAFFYLHPVILLIHYPSMVGASPLTWGLFWSLPWRNLQPTISCMRVYSLKCLSGLLELVVELLSRVRWFACVHQLSACAS